jgi:Transketolase, C-terminal subunit
VTACMEMAYDAKAPVYLRMGKSDRGDVHIAVPQVKAGNLLLAKPGKDSEIAFIATGALVRTAIDIAEESYPDAVVWSVPLIKPIDAMQVAAICEQSRLIVVLEEHSVLGGLGSAIAEIATEFAPVRILRVGVPDRFSHHCGTYDYLLKEHGLDSLAIAQRISHFLAEC